MPKIIEVTAIKRDKFFCFVSEKQNKKTPKENKIEAIIIKNFDDEEFIVINSDIWTDYNLEALKELKLEESLAHIVLIDTPDYLDGDFDCDGDSLLVGNAYVFSGIGKYHRELFNNHSNVDLGDILRSEKKITFSIFDGKWMDIGTPDRLEKIRQLEQDPK